MCRDIANGGRRCPSHTNPTLITKRNAKRREVYAKSKNSGLPSPVSSLGLHVVPVSVEETHDGYLNSQIISGVIDYTQIDEDSYKEFGFTNPINERQNTIHSTHLISNISVEEVKTLTEEEQAALRFFTSHEHEWLNSSLYKTKKVFNEEETFTKHEAYFADERINSAHLHDLSYTPFRTPQALQEITYTMDEALKKGRGSQRMVYRGISYMNDMFSELVKYSDYDKVIPRYAADNMKLGQEIVMDGYQSTSADIDSAMRYAGEDGLLLQVLTPSGVDVTSISEYRKEKEVILPRNSRYMVVGVHEGKVDGNFAVRQQITVIQLVEIDENSAIAVETNKNQKPLTREQIYKTEGN